MRLAGEAPNGGDWEFEGQKVKDGEILARELVLKDAKWDGWIAHNECPMSHVTICIGDSDQSRVTTPGELTDLVQ